MGSIIDFRTWRAARAAKKTRIEARKRGIPDEISKNFQQKRAHKTGPLERRQRGDLENYSQSMSYDTYEDLFADVLDTINRRKDGPFGIVIGLINDDGASIDYLKFGVTNEEVRRICDGLMDPAWVRTEYPDDIA